MPATSGSNENLLKNGTITAMYSDALLDGSLNSIHDENNSTYLRLRPTSTTSAGRVIMSLWLDQLTGSLPYIDSIVVRMSRSGNSGGSGNFTLTAVRPTLGNVVVANMSYYSISGGLTDYTYSVGYDGVQSLLLEVNMGPSDGRFLTIAEVYVNKTIFDSGLRFRGHDGITYPIAGATLSSLSKLRLCRKDGTVIELPMCLSNAVGTTTNWLDGTNGKGPKIRGKSYATPYYLRKYSA